MMHKASCGIEKVPYYFSKPSIKFQGHTVWQIDDFSPIWVKLLSRSQLSNPPDLLVQIMLGNTGLRRIFLEEL